MTKTLSDLIDAIEQELDASEPQPKGGQHVGPMASHWNMTPSTRKALRWLLAEYKPSTLVSGEGESRREKDKNDSCAALLPADPSAAVQTEALPNSFERAVWLCRELTAYPLPQIVPEGNSVVGLDWDEGAERVLTITLDDQNWVGYSYLVGEYKACGRVSPIAAVSMIREVLRLIYPEVGSGTDSLSEASPDTAQGSIRLDLEFCPRCSSGPRQKADTVECPDCGYPWSGPRLADLIESPLAAPLGAPSGIASPAASSAQKDNPTSSPVLADDNLVYSSELGYVLKAEYPAEDIDQLRAAVIELSNRHIPQHRIKEALDRLILAAEARGRQQGT